MIFIRKKTSFFSQTIFSMFCLFLANHMWTAELQGNSSYESKITSAQEENGSSEPTSVNGFNSKVQLGGNYTYLTLKPRGHTTFDGSLGGLQASYEYQPLNCFYGGLLFEWREGNLSSEVGERSVLYFDVQERLGYTFALKNKRWLITLFSGFAYRYLGEDFEPKEGYSLDFGYNEFYFPVGLLTKYRFNSQISFGIDFTWMPQVFSTVSIDPLPGARWNLTNRIDNFYVALPLTFVLTRNERFLITFKPTYQHWEDGHSTAKTRGGVSLGLPGNAYNFYGVDLNVAYCF